MFNKNLLKLSILLLVLVELFSLTSFLYPTLNAVAFFVLLALALIVSLKRLEWGLYIVLAELFIGSFGRLFFVEINETLVSLRIGLFIIVMAVWLGKLLNHKGESPGDFLQTKVGKWYTALAVVLVWGVVWGLARNEFANVFFDFNNWLYFLYILPFYQVFKNWKLKIGNWEQGSQNVMTILAAAVIVLSLKTILLEWFFAHQISGTIEFLYTWVRDFGIGEITYFTASFWRVFIQGQVWLLLGFFVFLGFLPPLLRGELRGVRYDRRIVWLVLILSSIALIISFSRSLWLGLIAGLLVFGLLAVFKFKWSFSKSAKWFVTILLIAALELGFVYALINIPRAPGGDFGAAVSQRLTGGEAASSSRVNQLRPLGREITQHPIIGSGFGTLVTYESADPRRVAATAGGSGEVTTFAFEWSYLDIMLKVGLAGLVVYLGLLWVLLKNTWTHVQTSVGLGLALAMIALAATNVTTPFLNHPLGIGFVILMTVLMVNNRANNQAIDNFDSL